MAEQVEKRYNISEVKLALDKRDLSQETVKLGWSFKWTDERVWAKKCMEHKWDSPVFESPFIYERGKRYRGGKNSKERQPGPFSLLHQARKTLPLLLEGVATQAASVH